MYRFLLRPKWIGFHLLVVVGIVTMINLGFWQLRRLDQRHAFNDEIEQRYDAAPEPLDTLLTAATDPADVEWRPAVVTGTYEPEGTIHIVNRSQNGFAGDNIVVPMRLADGRVLLVNRGFLPLGLDTPTAPAGEVEVVGRLRPSQKHRTGQLTDPETGVLTEAQRVDIPRLTPQIDGDVVPMYVDVFESVPADDPALQPVAAPELTNGPHLSYAVQWYIFSIAVAVGWVLAVRKSIRTHRRELAAAAPATPPA